jgi:hypothetical protein
VCRVTMDGYGHQNDKVLGLKRGGMRTGANLHNPFIPTHKSRKLHCQTWRPSNMPAFLAMLLPLSNSENVMCGSHTTASSEFGHSIVHVSAPDLGFLCVPSSAAFSQIDRT